jgi:hypothetical protein
MKRKKKITKYFVCPIVGCMSMLPYMKGEEAWCIKHGFKMVVKEVEE